VTKAQVDKRVAAQKETGKFQEKVKAQAKDVRQSAAGVKKTIAKNIEKKTGAPATKAQVQKRVAAQKETGKFQDRVEKRVDNKDAKQATAKVAEKKAANVAANKDARKEVRQDIKANIAKKTEKPVTKAQVDKRVANQKATGKFQDKVQAAKAEAKPAAKPTTAQTINKANAEKKVAKPAVAAARKDVRGQIAANIEKKTGAPATKAQIDKRVEKQKETGKFQDKVQAQTKDVRKSAAQVKDVIAKNIEKKTGAPATKQQVQERVAAQKETGKFQERVDNRVANKDATQAARKDVRKTISSNIEKKTGAPATKEQVQKRVDKQKETGKFQEKVQAAKTAAKAPAQETKQTPQVSRPKPVKGSPSVQATETAGDQAAKFTKAAGESAEKFKKTAAQTANETAKAVAEKKPKVQKKKPVAKSPFVAQPAAPKATGVTIADEGTVLEGAPAGMGPTSAGKEVMVMDQNQLNQRLAGDSSVRGTEANTADLGGQAAAAPEVQKRAPVQMSPEEYDARRMRSMQEENRMRSMMGGIGGMRPEMGMGGKGGQGLPTVTPENVKPGPSGGQGQDMGRMRTPDFFGTDMMMRNQDVPELANTQRYGQQVPAEIQSYLQEGRSREVKVDRCLSHSNHLKAVRADRCRSISSHHRVGKAAKADNISPEVVAKVGNTSPEVVANPHPRQALHSTWVMS
jgi:hypothetical protein